MEEIALMCSRLASGLKSCQFALFSRLVYIDFFTKKITAKYNLEIEVQFCSSLNKRLSNLQRNSSLVVITKNRVCDTHRRPEFNKRHVFSRLE